MLLKNYKEKVNAQALLEECQMLLAQLKELDPMRSRRYEEIGMFPCGALSSILRSKADYSKPADSLVLLYNT